MPKVISCIKKNGERRFPNELLLNIYEKLPFDGKTKFKFLNKDLYNFHKDRVKKIKNYLNPEIHVFCAHDHIEEFEFVEVRNTLERVKITFHKKHSTCEDCILMRNGRCKNEDNHKNQIRYLKFDDTGMRCVHPKLRSEYVYAIARAEVKDLFKSTCVKCRMLKHCTSCSIIDGNCGIEECERSLLPMSFDLRSFRGINFLHYHNLCRECFNGIPKNVVINLVK
jgi:hypothetical protein